MMYSACCRLAKRLTTVLQLSTSLAITLRVSLCWCLHVISACAMQAMLFAALSSVEGAVSPYPTARQLGGQPVPVASKPSLSSDILETSAPTAAITNAATGGAVLLSPRRPLQHIPVLSLQLAKYVWYGK